MNPNHKPQMIENFLENIQCPICYLAMVSPLRTPMIIPGCGHTICESCISKLHECPLCHHEIKNPTKNILALQFIDIINQNKLIPLDLNPPLPSDNKLLTQIEPICTFAATGVKYINQKWYQCKTCKISVNNGFCEICAKKCHKGHDVYLYSSSIGFYCDCPKLCHCQSLPKIKDMRCTYEINYGVPVEQPMYQCEDCHITNNFYICQNCAIKCHNGHNLRYIGIVKDKICHCFDQCLCKISSRKPNCTFAMSGKNYIAQPWYHCKTCGLVGKYGCCSACVHRCHKDHDVEFYCFADQFYCDCGDCFNEKKCQILNTNDSSYLTNCPNFSFENKDKKIRQRKYHCLTCGVFGQLGICEACAINCHINHSIEFVGIDSFCCYCSNTKKCQMSLSPLLHNDRKICDRTILAKEDLSACYTCYTCDKSGNIKICETCALKKHLSHDIHILGYMRFDCHK